MTETAQLKAISPLIPAGEDIAAAINFYQNQLGFTIIHTEGQPPRMAIAQRGDIQIFLVKNDYIALSESISLRIYVENIEKLYSEYKTKNSDIFHPNGGELATKPWGVKEFIILDPTGVCLTFYEPANSNN